MLVGATFANQMACAHDASGLHVAGLERFEQPELKVTVNHKLEEIVWKHHQLI
jgi:hypothetical protein